VDIIVLIVIEPRDVRSRRAWWAKVRMLKLKLGKQILDEERPSLIAAYLDQSFCLSPELKAWLNQLLSPIDPSTKCSIQTARRQHRHTAY